jgi:hypothetical protein
MKEKSSRVIIFEGVAYIVVGLVAVVVNVTVDGSVPIIQQVFRFLPAFLCVAAGAEKLRALKAR